MEEPRFPNAHVNLIGEDGNAMAPEKQANARAYAVVAKRRTKPQFTSEFNRNEK